jgi:hypothetical protein
MTEPPRALPWWLAAAVATAGLLHVGGTAEGIIPAETLLDVSEALAWQCWQHRATRRRLARIVRRGWVLI